MIYNADLYLDISENLLNEAKKLQKEYITNSMKYDCCDTYLSDNFCFFVDEVIKKIINSY